MTGGRPRAPTCTRTDDLGHSCLRTGRALVTLLVDNTGAAGGQSKIKTLRCWEHYLELENTARKVSTVTVVNAEIFDSTTGKIRR